MDPIECAYVNHSQYCWVTGSAGTKGTESEPLGAYLFPIIQHYDKARAALRTLSPLPPETFASCMG